MERRAVGVADVLDAVGRRVDEPGADRVDPDDEIVPPYECGLDAAVDVIGGKGKVSILWATSTWT